MKSSKLTVFVFLVHVAVLGLLLIQPGCNTKEPLPPQEPTLTSVGQRQMPSKSDSSDLDAFNASLDSNVTAKNLSGPLGDRPRLTPKRPSIIEEELLGSVYDSGSTYTIQKGDTLWVIAKKFDVPLTQLIQINNLKKESPLAVGKTIVIPTKSGLSDSEVLLTTPESSVSYKVVSGDSLSTIAKRYKVSTKAIKSANNLRSDVIRVGQTLNIPNGEAVAVDTSYKASETLQSVAEKSINSNSKTHTVKSGETLSDIARRYRITTAELTNENNILDPRKLKVGQTIRIATTAKAEKPETIPASSVISKSDEAVMITKARPDTNATDSYLRATDSIKEDDGYLFDSEENIPIIPVDIAN
jgi:LysM repeat protein